jgi:hypothetical protein
MPNIPILSTSYPNRVKSTHEGAKSLWPTLEPGILTVTSTELNSLLAYLTKYLLRPMLRKKRTRGYLALSSWEILFWPVLSRLSLLCGNSNISLVHIENYTNTPVRLTYQATS